MPTLEAVREDLETASDTLDQLRGALRQGENVDMDAFTAKVTETCKAAVGLPKAEAPQVRQQLETLLQKLNDTRAEIESEETAIAAELTRAETAAPRTAHTAGLVMPNEEPIASDDESQ